ncbi:UDP-N-acetylmuramyl pentapeptide phosphotransferase [Calderihabitans maritimus]|uniref:UDP-N-acetylmuramyl pentapeptide phosphotransferase n=1 Tax=Calderihabitans maritimus TaxID=1246530 RepID=UPI001EDCE4CE|nr:UDP-N-acetylmuramyl pentapeptide phosphotransferase [Calderihabitans maritimus]
MGWLGVLSFIITFLILPSVLRLERETGLLADNYRGESIPSAGGLGIILGFMSAFFLVSLWWQPENSVMVIAVSFLLTGLVGFVDDVAGNREVRGLAGHLGQLWRRRHLTTGGLKALVGGGTAFYASKVLFSDWMQALFSAAVVALLTNTLNLLDLRPGRSLKFFFLLTIIFVTASGINSLTAFLLGVGGAALAFFHYDLTGKAMLGDTGSNALGMVLGLAAAAVLPLGGRIILLFLLVCLHWYTEKHSLTALIERVRWLRLLDNLGRR